jgi:hypothetical protein
MKIYRLSIKEKQKKQEKPLDYIDIAHNKAGQNKPYILWIIKNGEFKQSPILTDQTTHSEFFGKEISQYVNNPSKYSGRYDINTKTISIGSDNGEIPNPILSLIKSHFPQYEKIYMSGFWTQETKRIASIIKNQQNQQSINLWLDDERNPTNPTIQQQYNSNGNETWVKTVEEAIVYIQQGLVKSISFDNDLGEGNKEGQDLAKWIEEEAYFKRIPPMQWKVHSQNPKGKQYIIMAMQNADKFWNQ